jgi:hypothetical protein
MPGENNGLDPIEAGWQALLATLGSANPANQRTTLSDEAAAILRFVFFAGARHYREMIKALFELEDGDERYQTLLDIATEIAKWENDEEAFPASLRKTT